jgi:magnesium-transporting ATPase (P-type)
LDYSTDLVSNKKKVIAQRKGNEHYNVFIKGAPEIVAELCNPVTGSISITHNIFE